jgi:hypothetical protein
MNLSWGERAGGYALLTAAENWQMDGNLETNGISLG